MYQPPIYTSLEYTGELPRTLRNDRHEKELKLDCGSEEIGYRASYYIDPGYATSFNFDPLVLAFYKEFTQKAYQV